MRRKLLIPGLIILLVVVIFSIGCMFSPSHDLGYKPGRIKVYFKENVSVENATAIVSSFNCTVVQYYYVTFTKDDGTTMEQLRMIVKVPEGKEKEYVELFKQNASVSYACLLLVER